MKRLLPIIPILLGSGCGSLDTEYPEAVRIFQWYVYEYQVTADRTVGRALFAIDNPLNPPLQIKPPASFKINGIEPDFNPGDSLPYTVVMEGLNDLGLFVYVDENRRQFTNIANLGNARSIGIPDSLSPIPASDDFTLTWQGSPLAGGDVISLQIEGSGGEMRSYRLTEIGTTGFTIPVADIKALGPGPSTWTISRTSPIPMQDTNPVGGRLFLRFTYGPLSLLME